MIKVELNHEVNFKQDTILGDSNSRVPLN